MTKIEIVDEMLERTELQKVEIGRFLDALTLIIQDSLKKQGKVNLAGLRIFTVRTRKARLARNPMNGAQVQVAAKRVVLFKPGKRCTSSAEIGEPCLM
jgi:nucleoid DNA-binding protein